jgi:hypothetical protein
MVDVLLQDTKGVQVFFANAHDAGIRYTKTLNYLSPEEFERKNIDRKAA